MIPHSLSYVVFCCQFRQWLIVLRKCLLHFVYYVAAFMILVLISLVDKPSLSNFLIMKYIMISNTYAISFKLIYIPTKKLFI